MSVKAEILTGKRRIIDFLLAPLREHLHDAMREAVRTSPDSFLKTVADVDAEPPDYWIAEIRSSNWAVAQRGGKVVGMGHSRPAQETARRTPDQVPLDGGIPEQPVHQAIRGLGIRH